MNREITEHIGIYKNVYPDGYCQHLINEFNRLEEAGAGGNRQQTEGVPTHFKDDYSIAINVKNHVMLPFDNTPADDVFFDGLQRCYDAYIDVYSVLKQSGQIHTTHMKMQRTGPGGGYHVWHGEQSSHTPNRVLTYILYLNDILPEHGGETEFLYQRKRVNPVENTVVLWPAAFTHAHRGNPVLGCTHKYIVTGWFNYE